MNVTSAEVREMAKLCWEVLLGFHGAVGVGKLYSCLNILCVTSPHLQAVVHPTGDDLGAVHVEVRTENLVPMSLHPSKYNNVVFSFYIP